MQHQSERNIPNFFNTRVIRAPLSPVEFDNHIFLACLKSEQKSKLDSVIENIPCTEFVDLRAGMKVFFPKFDVLMDALIQNGLLTSEIKTSLMTALRRPSSPLRQEIHRIFQGGTPSPRNMTPAEFMEEFGSFDEETTQLSDDASQSSLTL